MSTRTLLALAAAALVAAVLVPAAPATARPLPNILVIVTDDQPKGTLDAMSNVQERLAGRGLTFRNGIIPTSLCCPSRASLLTGDHSHTTGVWTNKADGLGAWPAFHAGAEADTLASRLDAVGYDTGLYGKYLNGFKQNAEPGYVPPGWDTFRVFAGEGEKVGLYYDYRLTGDPTFYGSKPADYSTDVLGQLAVDHINDARPGSPWFVMFAPNGPHAPFLPAPRDEGTWPLEPASAIGALNEKDVSDKPAWVREKPYTDPMAMRTILTRQHETLMSIDDWVGRLLDASDLSNTIVVFLSDNGFMLGAHRIIGKDVPYTRSSEVPMYVRWDGVIAPGTRTRRVTPQIDLTAMLAKAAGLRWRMEGRDPLTKDRTGVVVEQTANTTLGGRHPAYCGWRTPRYLYVEYDGRETAELYDYAKDPDELVNVAEDHRYAEQVAEHRRAAREACSPTPPGFDW